MKTFLASISLLLVIALFLSPVLLVISGFVADLSWWVRLGMVCVGLLICWLVKPLSILLNKDLKII